MDSASHAPEDSSTVALEHENRSYYASLGPETPAFGNTDTVPRGSTLLPHATSSSYVYDSAASPTRSSVASDGYEHSYVSTRSEASTSLTSVPTVASEYGLALGQNAATGPYLPCDFVGWGSCNEIFDVDNLHDWFEHVEEYHLGDNFPRKVMCWFCPKTFKVSKSASKDERRINFWNRLQHIQKHIKGGAKDENDIRVDFDYAEHLYSAKLITEEVYRLARKATDRISYPDGSRSWVPYIRDIYPPSFVPQERLLEQERAKQVKVDGQREERERRRHHHHRKTSMKGGKIC
ncbi:hypothetical protein DL766_003452 [Monosporascus sp. MC13-8B]|uniref:C2H2-type domain-containing protein n=1 Tax=Monosporascus cannonballus TaxID=155416 RepID=A0ABY0HG49_9PEZI|nr:hypothetical protein DL762_001428 [Monosporascus cannonballus]RYP33532.1 hypothetical protein DL766_003452 [Monosporascus sp. MC13-8B]